MMTASLLPPPSNSGYQLAGVSKRTQQTEAHMASFSASNPDHFQNYLGGYKSNKPRHSWQQLLAFHLQPTRRPILGQFDRNIATVSEVPTDRL